MRASGGRIALYCSTLGMGALCLAVATTPHASPGEPASSPAQGEEEPPAPLPGERGDEARAAQTTESESSAPEPGSTEPGSTAESGASEPGAVESSASEPVSGERVDELVKKTLSDERYEFCHDDDFTFWEGDQELCKLAPSAAETCPGLARACNATSPSLGFLAWLEPLLSVLSALAWGLVIALVLALVIWVVRLALRARGGASGRRRAPRAQQAALTLPEETLAPEGTALRSAELLLERARAAAAAGRHDVALTTVHAALVRHLHDQGLIELHRARTNGDYARTLRSRPDLRDLFRDSARHAEEVQFGSRHAERETFAALFERIAPLVRAATALGVLLTSLVVGGCSLGTAENQRANGPRGLAAFQALLRELGVAPERVRASFSWEESNASTVFVAPDASPDEETWARMLEFAQRGGLVVVMNAASLPAGARAALDEKATETTAASPASDGSADARDAEDGWTDEVDTAGAAGAAGSAGAGGTAATTPTGGGGAGSAASATQARGGSASVLQGEAQAGAGGGAGSAAEASDDALDRCEPGTSAEECPCVPSLPEPRDDGLLLTATKTRGLATRPDEGVVFSCDEQPDCAYAVARWVGDGDVVLFATPELFQNAWLAVPGNAAILIDTLGVDGPVLWVDAFSGAEGVTPWRSVNEAGLAPWLIQLGVLGLGFALWRGAAFGKRRAPPRPDGRPFAAHVRALGEQYEKSGDARFALGQYGAWAFERLRRAVRPEPCDTLEALAAAVAARTGEPAAAVLALFLATEQPRSEGASPLPQREALGHLRALSLLVSRLTSQPREAVGSEKLAPRVNATAASASPAAHTPRTIPPPIPPAEDPPDPESPR